MANEQINVPSLVAILVLSGLIIRYLFFSPATGNGGSNNNNGTSSSSAAAARGGRNGRDLRAREAAAERIQQMFPQADRRAVLWDLQRNGGSIAATTERILAGRLDTPPITFQPPPPPGAATAAAGSSTAQAQAADKPAHPDLITRYQLKDKIAAQQGQESGAAEGGSGDATAKAWSSNREERQSLLQRRRDQMILEARRKMEAKLAAEKAAAAGGGGES